MRNTTIDSLKGILILLVILGHIISGGPLTEDIKYTLSTFRMPLFLGIAGYMLKKELFATPFLELAKKYFYRLIIPFLFAYFTYALINLDLIHITYYHLWFIPALLLFIVYIYGVEHLHINRTLILFLAFSFSVFWTGTYGFKALVDGFNWMGDKRFYYDFIFLFLGYYLRNTPKIFNSNWLFSILVFVSSAFYILIFNSKMEVNLIYATILVFFNLSLIYIVLRLSRLFDSIKIPYVHQIGKLSLPIYLWHIVPILILRSIVENYTLNIYLSLLLYFFSVVIIITLVFKYKSTSFVKVMFMGEQITMSGTKQ